MPNSWRDNSADSLLLWLITDVLIGTADNSFVPQKYAELLSDVDFEQPLLRGERFQARFERLTLSGARLTAFLTHVEPSFR